MAIKLSVADVNGIPVGATAPLVLLTGQPTNSVTFSLTCVGADTTLKGGAIVPQDSADGPASLYLGFSPDTFTDPHTFSVTLPAGWNYQWLETPYPVWALAPAHDVALASGTSLLVTISGVGVIARDGDRTLTAHLDHTPPHHVHKSFKVIAKQPGTDLTNIVDFGFDDDDDDDVLSGKESYDVFVSDDSANPIANTLVFHLSNLTQAPLVSQPWDGDSPPTFTLSFVTAATDDPDADGALTTPELADKIDVAVGQIYQDRWERLDRPAGDLSWRLRPLPLETEVLGAGAAGSVQFDITGIVSQLPVGITWAYLTYTHVPGYSDGFLARQISKRNPPPAAVIDSFVATPNPGPTQDGPSPVTLTWNVEHADQIELSNADIGLDITTDQQTWSGAVRFPTNFTLKATGKNGLLTTQVLHVPDLASYLPGKEIVSDQEYGQPGPWWWRRPRGRGTAPLPSRRGRFVFQTGGMGEYHWPFPWPGQTIQWSVSGYTISVTGGVDATLIWSGPTAIEFVEENVNCQVA